MPKFNVRRAVVSAGLCSALALGGTSLALATEGAPEQAPDNGGITTTASQVTVKFQITNPDSPDNQVQWSYNVNLDSNGYISSIPDVSNKDGWNFIGWYCNGDDSYAYSTEQVLTGFAPTVNMTFTTAWEKVEDPEPTYMLTIHYRDSLNDDAAYDWAGAHGGAQGHGWWYDPTGNTGWGAEGMEFAGWTYDKEGNIPVVDGDFDMLTGEPTIYAQWKAAETPATEYTFTFVVKDPVTGEVLDSKPVTVKPGEAVAEIPQFDIKGYTITGWTVDGYTYTPAEEVYNIHALSNLELVAELKAVETDVIANVTYRDSMSDWYWGPSTVTNGNGWYFDLAEDIVSHEGYQFIGWSLDAQGGELVTDKEMSTLGGDVTLYAQWKQIETPVQTVTVKFQITNPGTDVVLWSYTDDKHVAGELVTSIPQIEDKNGYTCVGWQTEDGTIYDLEQVKSFYPTSDLTFKTVWEKTETPVAVANLYYRDSMGDWSWGPSTIENGEGWYFDLAEDIVSHEGYKFIGWSLDAQGGELLEDGDLATTSGDVTLYAQWEKVETPVTSKTVYYYDTLDSSYEWVWNGYTGDSDWYFDPSANGAMTHDGMRFVGWSGLDGGQIIPEGSELTFNEEGSAFLYAQWEKVEDESSHLNITYKDSLNDDYSWTWTGAPADDWFFDPSANGAMAHDGYEFVGWSFNKNGEVIPEDALATTTGDVTLYAIWNQVDEGSHLNVYYKDSLDPEYSWTWVGAPADDWWFNPQANGAMTHEGYEFTGWTYDLEGTLPVAEDDLATTTGDVTVYAQWKAVDESSHLNIIYKDSLDDSYSWTWTGAPADDWWFDPSENGSGAMIHEGYTFAGWSFNKNGEIIPEDALATITGDVTLYAVWTANEDPITYHTVTFIDEENGTTTIQSVEDGATVAEPEAPALEGYTFAGWTLDGAAYDFATPVTSDLTLKASWTANETPVDPVETHTVTFVNKEAGTSQIETVEDGKTVAQPADPTVEGKTFVAWTDADGNAYDFSTPVTGDLTLYAQFKDVETPVTPTDPETPATPDDGNKDDATKDDGKKDEAKDDSKKNELPKTADETSTAGVAAAGVAGVAALGAGAALLNRRKREQN